MLHASISLSINHAHNCLIVYASIHIQRAKTKTFHVISTNRGERQEWRGEGILKHCIMAWPEHLAGKNIVLSSHERKTKQREWEWGIRWKKAFGKMGNL
jgi:peptide deformylase